MKALGKGSIASLIRTGLVIASIGLRIAAVLLATAAIAYAVLMGLIAAGVVQRADFAELLGPSDDNPAGLIWPIVVPSLLVGAVSIGGGLVIVSRLKRLFDGFSSGEPFRKDHAQHLRVIWITMTAVEVARMILKALTGVLLGVFGPARGVEVSVSINTELSTWASILILIVLAEVFREGARLKEEQELTI